MVDNRVADEGDTILLRRVMTNEILPQGVIGEYEFLGAGLPEHHVVLVSGQMYRLLVRRWKLMKAMVDPRVPAVVNGEELWQEMTQREN